ncbi:endoplasmic reticulum resident protein 27 isoform X1 [Zalophus californianus]|uniref:Endoplasmic reticulum resident protein 27 n=2 Tax=Zalophus californianus TaxID=9704 RepID=A0A6J2D841_ZALCA|nr:endoplasmic reticulum resident protein 27 isoform X1 [Zalophus californianus]XP_027451042.1 endoplasmic reticulum resident protein 27 isoform X1 [Zalophus californianus]
MMTVPLETVISSAIVYREKVEMPSAFRTPTFHLIPQHFLLLSLSHSLDGSASSQKTVSLTDVPATMEFIAAAEVAVIGFFQDLEIPAVSLFHSMVQNFQDVSFGISTDSEVLAHYNITRNTISLFRLVDNEKLDLESKDIEKIDASKLSRFIEINSLHLVTEYNPVKAIGLFNSVIQIHLLLMMNKASPEYEESLHRYQKAAKLFQGKILFILVDSGVKANGKVISFFKLKESQLPALAIYQTLDEAWDTLAIAEVSVEHVQNFCDGFLKGKRLRENHESEEKTPKAEL